MGPASSLKSKRNAIVVPARPPKRTPNSSSLVMPLWSPWSHLSPCALSPSLTSPHWVASPYVTCVKPSLSVRSNPSTSRMPPLERSPRPPKRLPRRSELWSWENYLRLNTPECYAYLQSHHLCRPVSERPLYYLTLTLHLSLFLSMLQKLVRILLSDWILLHCFHRKEFRRKASLFFPGF